MHNIITLARQWESLFEEKVRALSGDDPSHDLLHIKRVVKTAKHLAELEGGNLMIIIPAAWLHDIVRIPKDDPKRIFASRLSAEEAITFLKEIGYPEEWFVEIFHAIEAHSFSAQIEPKTWEAKIIQDADRLDAIGAIGIARCFTTGGLLGRPLYSPEDPFCKKRTPEDQQFSLDHFYKKLFKIANSLHTPSSRQEGLRRVEAMKFYIQELAREL